jgi:Domain of unknown function (DUF5053)
MLLWERQLMGLKEIFNYLSIQAVAQRMRKSRAWLSQRLNGNLIHGKPAEFTPEEKELLRKTLKDIASDIIDEADKLT